MRGSVEMSGSHPVAGTMYRTKICKFGKTCQYGDRCFYAHSSDEIRQRSESNLSCLSSKLNESPHRSSRRSSEILTEINHDLADFSALPLDISSRRNSRCTENDVNLSNVTSYTSSCRGVCVVASRVPRANLSVASVSENDRSPGSAGSLSPISFVSTTAASIVSGSYSYYFIKYMQSCLTPSALSKLLRDAQPEFYIE